MSQWIQTTNSNLRSIKVDGLSDDVWFTDQGYSEVTQSVGDLLATEIDSISKVSTPGTPGDYYESDYDGTTLTVNLESPSGPFDTITVTGTANVGSLDATDSISTEQITTTPGQNGQNRFPSTYSVKYTGPLRAPHTASGYEFIGKTSPVPCHQMFHADKKAATYTIYYGRYSNQLFRTGLDGSLEYVGRCPDVTTIDHAVMDPHEHWIIWDRDTDTAYHYRSTDDMLNGVIGNTMNNVHPPFNFGSVSYYNFGNGTYGTMWGEYISDSGPTDIRIIRMENGTGFETLATYSRTNYRHFHHLSHDPFNKGTFYATTGDADSEVQWFKSTDWGDTWTLMSGVGGDQKFRTVNMGFTEDYLYWASDTNKPAEFYRAARGGESSPEKLYTFPTDLYSYGVSYIDSPQGFLIVFLDGEGVVFDSIPIYFYSLEHETMTRVKDWKTQDYSTKAGIDAVAPYQSMISGNIPIDTNALSGLGAFTESYHLELNEIQF